MAMRWLAVVVAALHAPQVRSVVWWPADLKVSRHLFDTDHGSLHYYVGGEGAATGPPPLVLLHSDPRSALEFRYFVGEVARPRAFIAIDYFGMGFSDDCSSCNDDEYVSFPTYAGYIQQILAKHGVTRFVPVGTLKGTNTAIALADLAGAEAVGELVLLSPLMLSPTAVDYMLHTFIPSLKNPVINVTGDHLLKMWTDRSGAPYGPDFKIANDTADLLGNEEKTFDFLRCFQGGRAKNQMAWVNYNTDIVPAMRRVSRFAKVLTIESPLIKQEYNMYHLDPDWSAAQFDQAMEGGRGHVQLTIANASQGMMMRNATWLANKIDEFLTSKLVVV